MAYDPRRGITIHQGDDGSILLGGHLSVETVPDALARSENWFHRDKSLTVDLSDVRHSDSAGVALLLEWLRRAREHGCTLRYRKLPRQMQAIVDFSELGDILPLAAER